MRRMGLPLSGLPNQVVDLLHIETDQVIVTIKGKPIHPTVNQLQLHSDQKALLKIYPGSADIKHFDPFSPEENNLAPYEGPEVFPVFYENQDYQIFIQSKQEGLDISFYHQSRLLRQAVTRVRGVHHLLSGHLNFRNEVGFSEFEILSEDKRFIKVTFEVFPSKMDYRKDYVQLLQDVNEEIYNLAYDFLKKTFLTTGLHKSKKPSLSEFFAVLQTIFNQMVKAVDRIEMNPHSKMEKVHHIRSIEKVRKVSSASQRWLQKHPYVLEEHSKGLIYIQGKSYTPQKLREERKLRSYDTAENRFLKWMLQQLVHKVRDFEREYKNAFTYRELDEAFLSKLMRMRNQIRRLTQKEFYNDVGELNQISITLVMQMAPGYKDIYRFYLMLRKGLSIQSDMYKMSLKEISTLYEYWSFLKLHHILRQNHEVIRNDLVKVNDKGLFVTLVRSKSGKIRYRNPKNGEIFELQYNPLFKAGPVNQKPDHVLSLKKIGSDVTYKFVFDTKYKVNPALQGSDYNNKYTQPGPEEEDINTMHRYRDAIMYQDSSKVRSQLQRNTYGAYVLFPYTDEEEYKSHAFYKSIEQVNIGGLPFLPGSTTLVAELLDQIITESADASYERAISSRGSEEYYDRKKNLLNVLVGSIRQKSYDQLNMCLKHQFYHIPLQRIQKQLSQIKRIALYQQQGNQSETGGIHFYSKVVDFKIVKRKEIREIPANQRRAEALYVRFDVEQWKEREIPIVPRGYGIQYHILTHWDLFEQAVEIPELSLKSEEQYRLWRELRRVDQQLSVILKKKWLDKANDQEIEYQFMSAKLKVNLENNKVLIQVGEKSKEVSIADLRYRPKKIMN